ncbi:MAG TPA: M20/M25/M40 family metallo-hydrolase [Rhizomicrobium sp.]|nr:M20/M25/M40 family metallo-hydrolase [Rhizomicrobium sp.]
MAGQRFAAIACFVALTLMLSSGALFTGARAATPADTARAYVEAHKKQVVEEYLKLAGSPSLHGDVPNLKRTADLLLAMMKKRGLAAELWVPSNGIPVVFGEKLVPGARHTILFYIHYDGQPVDAKRWAQADPFKPVIRTGAIEHGGKTVTDLNGNISPDWRIYARAAGDDKVPIEAILTALDAVSPRENIKIFLHGEEEGGGPGQDEVIKKYPDKLKSDVTVILDGPAHPLGKATIYYGARGGANLTVTVYTAKQGMHSGNYGNWMPDANVRLSQLISSMVDSKGKVVVKDFYSDVLPFKPDAVAMMKAVPDQSADIRKEYGVGGTDGAAAYLQEGLNLPSFSIHRMSGGEVGGVIPGSATAEIAMRLVKENRPGIMVQRVIAHIRAQGYFVVDKDPDVATLAAHDKIAKIVTRTTDVNTSGGAWRTDPNDPQAQFITQAMQATWGRENVIRIRTTGGGVPATPFIDAFHVPVVGIEIANYDDNQHSDNENLRLGNLFDGVVTLAGVMTE